MDIEPDKCDPEVLDLQSRVDGAANKLLTRGIRPTVSIIEVQVEGSRPRIEACLESWAHSLAASVSDPDHQSRPKKPAIDMVVRIPHERRIGMTHGAQMAGQVASRRKDEKRREAHRRELVAEIVRAQLHLERLEARQAEGDPAPSLSDAVEKSKRRLQQMQKVLAETSSPPDAGVPR